MITVNRVSKWFGSVRAVADVSFDIQAGQIVGLLGPNGAGKTTTLRMITGFLPPSLGSVTVAGHDTIQDSINARRALGYLPEAAPLYPEMRVVDYLKYRSRLYGVATRERRGAIARVLERCWLSPVARRRVGQLSKGFKQRVGLAGAMLHDPRVLILDEPTSGLDPTQIRETRSLIRELAHKRTVIISSHILPEVERTCDRVLIIARGKLRADGNPDTLLAPLRDASAYVVEIGSADAGNAKQALGAIPGVQSVDMASASPLPTSHIPHPTSHPMQEPRRLAPGALKEHPWTPIRVHPFPGSPDLREPIARALAKTGAITRELRRESPTLEQLFFRIIEADESGGDDASAANERPRRA